MENQSPNYIPRPRDDHQEPSSDFNLNDWDVKASRISRHNTSSRRFSASNIRSFREDSRSFRSNFTISSTASSPGYPFFRDEIDPSTYSFTTALKALQARSGYVWECLSPEGFALNSKWSDAEKYISNPLSGKVPMECLSAKTLSVGSFHDMMANRITMSAPLIYPASSHHSYFSVQTSNKLPSSNSQENVLQIPIRENKVVGATRDVGVQSMLTDEKSSSPSPASTPSIGERMTKRCSAESGESPHSNSKMKSEEEVSQAEAKGETGEEEEEEEEGGSSSTRDSEEGEKEDERRSCRCRQVGCLSWMSKRKQRENHRRRPARKIKVLLSQIGGAC